MRVRKYLHDTFNVEGDPRRSLFTVPPVLFRKERQSINRSRSPREIPEEVPRDKLRPEDRSVKFFASPGVVTGPFFIMQVILLSHTPHPDALVASAARICYRDITANELLQGEEKDLSRALIAELFRSGHMSTFEHVSFTFGIDGLSRVSSHQLVRHRLASFSQQSQRYVKMNDDLNAVIIPPSIQNNPEALKIFHEIVKATQAAYKSLTEMGIPKEDARFILPHGHSTRLVMTMNARELHHFFGLRLCKRAQWEIHELARKMLLLCREEAPVLFERAGPSCIFGKCGEARSCNKPYSNMEDLLSESE